MNRRTRFRRHPAPPATPATPAAGPDVVLRTAFWSDLPRIVEIERELFDPPASETQFRRMFGWHGIYCTVAEVDGTVQGFLVEERGYTVSRVLNLAVARDFRRRGLGCRLVIRSAHSMTFSGCLVMEAAVDESPAAGPLFWRSLGFKAVPDHLGRYTNAGGRIRFRRRFTDVFGGPGRSAETERRRDDDDRCC